ncbi:MAG: galactosyldiacylglycerol synthase [Piscinibacter sp.]|nr:galactosyldiacylglycerol synthase [Piscinibacter sp.]
MTKTIALVYFNAGGGHRAAAQALEAVIRAQRRPWRVELVNLVEVLDPQQRFRKLTGVTPEDLYNKRLARGWTLGMAQELKLLQAAIRFGHAAMVRMLQQRWLRAEPDLVVSLVPNFNRALHESVATSLPGVPYATVMTDIADLPPNFWIEPGLDQHVVCGSERAREQARAAGYPDTRLHLTSGMILRPDFYDLPPLDRPAERARLGLPAQGPVGVLMFGGQGSMAMLRIARLLDGLPLILMCGHNRLLAQRARALRRGAPQVVVEFTPDVARWLRLADFLVGKPGPGSLSEAVQLGLPVVTSRNAWTMPQERYNTEWLQSRGLGVVHRSLRTLPAAVDELLRHLPELQANVARVRNRAVLEVPDILQSILSESAAPPHWRWVGQTPETPGKPPDELLSTRETP